MSDQKKNTIIKLEELEVQSFILSGPSDSVEADEFLDGFGRTDHQPKGWSFCIAERSRLPGEDVELQRVLNEWHYQYDKLQNLLENLRRNSVIRPGDYDPVLDFLKKTSKMVWKDIRDMDKEDWQNFMWNLVSLAIMKYGVDPKTPEGLRRFLEILGTEGVDEAMRKTIEDFWKDWQRQQSELLLEHRRRNLDPGDSEGGGSSRGSTSGGYTGPGTGGEVPYGGTGSRGTRTGGGPGNPGTPLPDPDSDLSSLGNLASFDHKFGYCIGGGTDKGSVA